MCLFFIVFNSQGYENANLHWWVKLGFTRGVWKMNWEKIFMHWITTEIIVFSAQYEDPHTSTRTIFSFSMSLNGSSVSKLFFSNTDDVCKWIKIKYLKKYKTYKYKI